MAGSVAIGPHCSRHLVVEGRAQEPAADPSRSLPWKRVNTTMDQSSRQLLFATFAYLMAISGVVAVLGVVFSR